MLLMALASGSVWHGRPVRVCGKAWTGVVGGHGLARARQGQHAPVPSACHHLWSASTEFASCHAGRSSDPPGLSALPRCACPGWLQEPGQKIIDTDTAAQMLALVLPGAPFVDSFCKFLTEQKDYKKSEAAAGVPDGGRGGEARVNDAAPAEAAKAAGAVFCAALRCAAQQPS